MLLDAPAYHAHVYFLPAETLAAADLREAALAALGGLAGLAIYPMRERPVGPHARPMFEIEFPGAHRVAVMNWLEGHHAPFPVLIHPVTGDDLADHRDHAAWLGEVLPLDYSVLE